MDFVTMNELASRLQVSLPMIKRLIKNGANGRPPLPCHKVGRCVRIAVSDFEGWIEIQPSPVAAKRGRPLGATKKAMAARRTAEANYAP